MHGCTDEQRIEACHLNRDDLIKYEKDCERYAVEHSHHSASRAKRECQQFPRIGSSPFAGVTETSPCLGYFTNDPIPECVFDEARTPEAVKKFFGLAQSNGPTNRVCGDWVFPEPVDCTPDFLKSFDAAHSNAANK
jgi:hypothetical protein